MAGPDPRPVIQSYALSLLTSGLIVVVVLGMPCCGVTLGAVSGLRDGPMVGMLCGLMSLVVVAPVLGIGLGLAIRRRLVGPLDQALSDLDPSPRRYMLSGRAWIGAVRGRDVQVTLRRGPHLAITVAVDARARLAVGWDNALGRRAARATGFAQLDTDELDGFEGLAVYAKDSDWARAVLSRPGVAQAVARATQGDGLSVLRALNVEADAVTLSLHRLRLQARPDDLRVLVDALVTIAEGIEDAPLPAVPETPSALVARLRPVPLVPPNRS